MWAAALWSVGALVVLQTANGYQVGALYTGGNGARPRLNQANCDTFDDLRVAVDFQTAVTLNTTGVVPYGVLYTDDVPIPAVTQQSASSGGAGTTATLTAAVGCGEPVASRIIQDNIPLPAGAGAFALSRYLVSNPTVSDVMMDLCNNPDGGVRVRRAYCLGIRNGQGSTTVVRGGDGPDIDTQPPGVPSSIRVEAGDQYADVYLTPPAGTDSVEALAMRYVIQGRKCQRALFDGDGGVVNADAGWNDAGANDVGDLFCEAWRQVGGPALSPVQVTGLDNSVDYQFRAYAVDDFDNSGPTGGTAYGRPRKEYGLLDLYGNPVYGGSCSQGPLGMMAALALLLALGARQRRKGQQ